MKVKTQIKLTYRLKDAQGQSKQIDDAFLRMMETIGAKFYAQGIETESNIRDICYDLDFPINDE